MWSRPGVEWMQHDRAIMRGVCRSRGRGGKLKFSDGEPTNNQTNSSSMKTDIFLFDELPVRVAMIDDEPWFVGTDAARILGITQVASTLRSFPDDEKGVHSMHTPGGQQNMTVLNEPGLYRLIFQSRKAEAERFKKWVFTDVLPSIRKTGCYGVEPAGDGELTELKRTLKISMDGLLAGTLPVAKAQALAVLAQRWLEAHRAEADTYGHTPNENMPGLPGRRAANRILSPEKRGAADAVQAVPQPEVPGEGEVEPGLQGEADGGEAEVGSTEPETETPA